MVKFWDNGIVNGSGEKGVGLDGFQWLSTNAMDPIVSMVGKQHWCQWNGNGFPSIELDETSMVFNGSPLLVLLTIVQV